MEARADLGQPIDGYFARHPEPLRAVLEALGALVAEAVPDASSAIKWGMPTYSLGGKMFCSLGGHKEHVNLVLWAPPDAFADPEGRLTGEGTTGRHLRLTSLEELPRESVLDWVRTSAAQVRG
jgi:hypothetical protein